MLDLLLLLSGPLGGLEGGVSVGVVDGSDLDAVVVDGADVGIAAAAGVDTDEVVNEVARWVGSGIVFKERVLKSVAIRGSVTVRGSVAIRVTVEVLCINCEVLGNMLKISLS